MGSRTLSGSKVHSYPMLWYQMTMKNQKRMMTVWKPLLPMKKARRVTTRMIVMRGINLSLGCPPTILHYWDLWVPKVLNWLLK